MDRFGDRQAAFAAFVQHILQTLRKFFEQYERSRKTFDVGLIDSQYPDSFMFAGPNGVRVAEKATVLAGLSKGQELFQALGQKRPAW